MFTSILTNTSSGLSVPAVLICVLVSLVSGMILAMAYKAAEHPSKSFTVTIAILPAVVMLVILMVNGNLGAGVAVAGSFSLVRFRSMPGKASDILVIFIAMAMGLCTGMGYVWLEMAAVLLFACVWLIFMKTPLLSGENGYRQLRVTIPEDLDYVTVFDDLFAEYTDKAEIASVRTVNLGTLYQITYDIELKDSTKEKEFLDAVRVRNGNLSVISSHAATQTMEL
ncbi:MAG: DUF4956 domain-containing protein [Solobacterium sp.]|nr:DUF4956 domain-containing protein [Solobacterium sp.]